MRLVPGWAFDPDRTDWGTLVAGDARRSDLAARRGRDRRVRDGAACGPPTVHGVLFSMTLEAEQFDVYTAAADGSDLARITDSELLEEAWTWLP